jgi:hypothetical protein
MPFQNQRLRHVTPLPIAHDREQPPIPIAPMRFQADAAFDEDGEPILRGMSCADLRRALAAHLRRIQAHDPNALRPAGQGVAVDRVASPLSLRWREGGHRDG